MSKNRKINHVESTKILYIIFITKHLTYNVCLLFGLLISCGIYVQYKCIEWFDRNLQGENDNLSMILIYPLFRFTACIWGCITLCDHGAVPCSCLRLCFFFVFFVDNYLIDNPTILMFTFKTRHSKFMILSYVSPFNKIFYDFFVMF